MTLPRPKEFLKDLQKKWLKILRGFQAHSKILAKQGRSGRPNYISLLNASNKQELSKADPIVLPDINFFGEEIVNILIGENTNY
jgi:hypothetical protein